MPSDITLVPSLWDFAGWLLMAMTFYFPITLIVIGVAIFLAFKEPVRAEDPTASWAAFGRAFLIWTPTVLTALQLEWASHFYHATYSDASVLWWTWSNSWYEGVPFILLAAQIALGTALISRARRRRFTKGLVLLQLYVGLWAFYAVRVAVQGGAGMWEG